MPVGVALEVEASLVEAGFVEIKVGVADCRHGKCHDDEDCVLHVEKRGGHFQDGLRS